MYLAVVALTMFIVPIASIITEHLLHPLVPTLFLVGRWFVFWSVGVRLALAGLRQVCQPAFTARQIFHMQGDEALPLVRELGLANLATASVGLLSLIVPDFVRPVAISATIFFGAAGLRHAFEPRRSLHVTIAMVSDLFLSLVLAVYLIGSILA